MCRHWVRRRSKSRLSSLPSSRVHAAGTRVFAFRPRGKCSTSSKRREGSWIRSRATSKSPSTSKPRSASSSPLAGRQWKSAAARRFSARPSRRPRPLRLQTPATGGSSETEGKSGAVVRDSEGHHHCPGAVRSASSVPPWRCSQSVSSCSLIAAHVSRRAKSRSIRVLPRLPPRKLPTPPARRARQSRRPRLNRSPAHGPSSKHRRAQSDSARCVSSGARLTKPTAPPARGKLDQIMTANPYQ